MDSIPVGGDIEGGGLYPSKGGGVSAVLEQYSLYNMKVEVIKLNTNSSFGTKPKKCDASFQDQHSYGVWIFCI